MMGDKTAARALAKRIGVPVLPGTEDPITDRAEALRREARSAFRSSSRRPSAAAAAACAWCRRRDLAHLLDEAQGEAGRAFGNPPSSSRNTSPRQAHRGADPRRPARQRHPPARARLLRPAPPPEGDRGRAQLRPAGARRARTVRRRRADGPRDPLRQRRHRRVPLRPRPARVVLHRDEPAHPGRAHGDRGDHRPRPRARADPDRAGPRAALAEVGMPRQADDAAQRLRDPVPHHHRGSREQVHPRLRPHPRLPLARRLRRPARRRHGLRRRGHHAVLRLAAREGITSGQTTRSR
jgi:hypothetical protein